MRLSNKNNNNLIKENTKDNKIVKKKQKEKKVYNNSICYNYLIINLKRKWYSRNYYYIHSCKCIQKENKRKINMIIIGQNCDTS